MADFQTNFLSNVRDALVVAVALAPIVALVWQMGVLYPTGAFGYFTLADHLLNAWTAWKTLLVLFILLGLICVGAAIAIEVLANVESRFLKAILTFGTPLIFGFGFLFAAFSYASCLTSKTLENPRPLRDIITRKDASGTTIEGHVVMMGDKMTLIFQPDTKKMIVIPTADIAKIEYFQPGIEQKQRGGLSLR